jgi:hypothetical protein
LFLLEYSTHMYSKMLKFLIGIKQTASKVYWIVCSPRSTSWYFSVKHAALRDKSKDRLARNQNYVSGWSYMSTHGLLFQWARTINIQLYVMIYYKASSSSSHQKCNIFSQLYTWKIAELMLNNNHWLVWLTGIQYINKHKRVVMKINEDMNNLSSFNVCTFFIAYVL